MPSVNINRLDLDKIDNMLRGSMASEIRRMAQERASLIDAMTHSHSLAEQLNKLVGTTSVATQLTKQWQESQKAQQESIRRMLDPLQDIRKGLLADGAAKRMLGDFAKAFPASEHIANLMQRATDFSAVTSAMSSSIQGSMENTRKMLADVSVSSGIGHLIKSFEATNKRWAVPKPLLDSLGPLQALQEQIGRLSLPVMDTASAATLARVLGPEGIRAQLAAMGINPDGSTNAEVVQQEEGIGLSRRTLELLELLGFILAILVPIYQEISSSQWQAATDKRLAAQTQKIEAQGDALEIQRSMIEGLTKLVEKALVQEAKRQEERFVVRDRVAVVRSKPEHGSAIESKLLPREVVRPISESGKWIEFEYYHWLYREYRTGWALKKYLQRVPTNFKKYD